MSKPTFNSETKVWSGPKVPPLYNPDQNLGQLIIKVLELTPDAVTQVSADTGVEVTCGEMRERILKVAVHLSNLGLKQGDVIGVVAGNTENLAPTVFACFLLGLPVNPLAPIMTEADIVQMYSKTKPKLILCDGGNVEIVQNAVNTMKSEAIIYTIMEDIAGYYSVTKAMNESTNFLNFTYPRVDPHSTALIMCSSGSTSFPKGIQKSHHNIIIDFYPRSNYNPAGRSSVFAFSAIFWYTGSYFMITGTLFKFTRVITVKPFDADFMVDVIRRYNVTNVFTAPFGIVNLLQLKDLQPLESIKSWLVGGAAVTRDLCDKLKPFMPNGVITTAFGSTEQGMITVNNNERKSGSSGVPIANSSIKIVDDAGSAIDNYQQGEIYGKVPSKFLGYIGEPEKYAEAFDGEWFRTGDIGYFDDDGYIYVIDRKKELLKFNNYQVTPSELEALINEIEGVLSSCVVGVLEENTGNDIIHAFVIADESTSGLSEDFVLSYVNERVMDPKRLRGGVHFVKSLEVGLTGKVDRNKMKKKASELK